MKTAFRKSFARDVKKVKDQSVLERVRQVIEEVENAGDLSSVSNVRKIGGSRNFFRIRVGDH